MCHLHLQGLIGCHWQRNNQWLRTSSRNCQLTWTSSYVIIHQVHGCTVITTYAIYLLTIQEEMPICSNSFGPSTDFPRSLFSSLRSWPYSFMVVQEVSEVVLDEVFPRHPQINRIPIAKFTLESPCRMIKAFRFYLGILFWGEGGKARKGGSIRYCLVINMAFLIVLWTMFLTSEQQQEYPLVVSSYNKIYSPRLHLLGFLVYLLW